MARETPDEVAERLFVAANAVTKTFERPSEEQATELLYTEFNRAPVMSVLRQLSEPKLIERRTQEELLAYAEGLLSNQVVEKFARASAVHVWALGGLTADLTMLAYRRRNMDSEVIMSLALRLSVMQAQVKMPDEGYGTDEEELSELPFPSAAEEGDPSISILGDNFVVLLVECLLSASQDKNDPRKVIAFADVLAVCIGNNPRALDRFVRNDGLRALHLALLAVIDLTEADLYFKGLFSCFELARRAFYGYHSTHAESFAKEFHPDRLLGVLLQSLSRDTPVGFASSAASTCAVLAASSPTWRSNLSRSASSFLVKNASAAHLFAWVALAYEAPPEALLQLLRANQAVARALAVIKKNVVAPRPTSSTQTSKHHPTFVNEKAVKAAVSVLTTAVVNGRVEDAQVRQHLERLGTVLLAAKHSKSKFSASVYNHTLDLLRFLNPQAYNHLSHIDDSTTKESIAKTVLLDSRRALVNTPAKQDALIQRMLPAIRLAAPFLTAAFAAYSHAEHGQIEDVFLQLYVPSQLAERAGRTIPPMVVDAVARVSFRVRFAHACDHPSLAAIGRSHRASFVEPEPSLTREDLELAQKVIDASFGRVVKEHPNVTGMCVSAVRQRGAATESPTTSAEVVIAVYVYEKGVIPYGSKEFPKTLRARSNQGSLGVDVREGHFEPFATTANEHMVQTVNDAFAGCSVSTDQGKPFSVGVYATLDDIPGFISCSHGVKECGQHLDDDAEVTVFAPSRRDAADALAVGKTVTSSEIGRAQGRYMHYETAGHPAFPDGIDVSFVATGTPRQRLSFISARRVDWLDVLDRNGETTFPLTQPEDIPCDPVQVVGTSTLQLVAAAPETQTGTEPIVPVIKFGRSSGLTRGGLRAQRHINIVKGTLFQAAKVPPATFMNVLSVMRRPDSRDFALPGDSGSPVLQLELTAEDRQPRARLVGLLLGSFDGQIIILPHHRITAAFRQQLHIGIHDPARFQQDPPPPPPLQDDLVMVGIINNIAQRLDVPVYYQRTGNVPLVFTVSGVPLFLVSFCTPCNHWLCTPGVLLLPKLMRKLGS